MQKSSYHWKWLIVISLLSMRNLNNDNVLIIDNYTPSYSVNNWKQICVRICTDWWCLRHQRCPCHNSWEFVNMPYKAKGIFFPKIFLLWTHFEVFIEFITILLLFLWVLLFFWSQGMWDPSSPTRHQTHTPCIGGWNPNHWTKVPKGLYKGDFVKDLEMRLA